MEGFGIEDVGWARPGNGAIVGIHVYIYIYKYVYIYMYIYIYIYRWIPV